MQFFCTVAETAIVVVAGLCATADMEARPRARNPTTAADSTVFDHFTERKPRKMKLKNFRSLLLFNLLFVYSTIVMVFFHRIKLRL